MYYFPSRRYTGIGGNIQRYVTMASSAPGPADPVAALLLARERQHAAHWRAGHAREQCVGWNDEDEKTGSFALVLSSLFPYSLVVSCNMLISVAELSQASSSTAITAPVRPDVEFCNAEPAIAIEDEDTLLLEFNSSPLDEL